MAHAPLLIQLVEGLTVMSFFRRIFWIFFRLVLAARYRVRVRGLDQLKGLKGPVLVLPNHPGYIDPILVFTVLWPRLRMRPMIYTGNFKNLFFRLVARLLNAHKVPDMDQASKEARSQANLAVAGAIEGLKQGQNHILWPAGHVWRSGGVEHLGAARAAADILQAVPEAAVVLVRTRGVWAVRSPGPRRGPSRR